MKTIIKPSKKNINILFFVGDYYIPRDYIQHFTCRVMYGFDQSKNLHQLKPPLVFNLV